MQRNIIFKVLTLLRYRFFLFVGLFPYFLGQILAFNIRKSLNWHNFWWGFLGISLALIGVELFNEYFDAKEGGDRIFIQQKPNIPDYFFPLGLFVFSLAFLIGLYLTIKVGWPIILFSFLGFLGAYFYVSPPLKWAYRGWGELVIALSYGPLMVLGSYYLQTKRIGLLPVLVSLILGLLIFSLAIVNEIPDYYQDKLVGKKNLVVRLGKRKVIRIFTLSITSVFILLSFGIGFRVIPLSSIFVFIFLPRVLKSIRRAKDYYDFPKDFLPVIRTALLTYIIVVSCLGLSYFRG